MQYFLFLIFIILHLYNIVKIRFFKFILFWLDSLFTYLFKKKQLII